jgi:hypothetical protein
VRLKVLKLVSEYWVLLELTVLLVRSGTLAPWGLLALLVVKGQKALKENWVQWVRFEPRQI